MGPRSMREGIRRAHEFLCECLRCQEANPDGKFVPWRTLSNHSSKISNNLSVQGQQGPAYERARTCFEKRREDLEKLMLDPAAVFETVRRRPTSEYSVPQQPQAANGTLHSHPSSSPTSSPSSSALNTSSSSRTDNTATDEPVTSALYENTSSSNVSSTNHETSFNHYESETGGGGSYEEEEILDNSSSSVPPGQDEITRDEVRAEPSTTGGVDESMLANSIDLDLDRETREQGDLTEDGIRFLADEVDDPRLPGFLAALETRQADKDKDEDDDEDDNEDDNEDEQVLDETNPNSQNSPPLSASPNLPSTSPQPPRIARTTPQYTPGPKPILPPSPPPTLTADERLSLKLRYDNLKRGSTQSAYTDNIKIWKEEADRDVLSLHEVDKLSRKLSGVGELRVDICPNGCMAYAGPHKDKTFCDQERKVTLLDENGVVIKTAKGKPKKKTVICKRSRYKTRGSTDPVLSIPYFSIVDRMRALFNREDTARALRSLGERIRKSQEFRNREGGDGRPQAYNDFGDGDHLNKLFETPNLSDLFEDVRTTFFNFSTDGAIVKLGREGDMWSIEITITNLPIEMGRYQREFQWTSTLIPAPLPPVDLESFFYPPHDELQKARIGYWFWDAAAKEYFLWKGASLLLLADQMGMVKLSGMIGSRGYSPCWFCSIVRCYANSSKSGVYCPLHTVKLSLTEKEELNHDREDYDANKLPMRTPASLRQTAYQFIRSPKDRVQVSRQTGVSRISLFMRSPLYLHPSSTPSDISHLFFEDTGKSYWELLVKSHITSVGLGRIRDLYETAYRGLPSSICSGKARSIVDFFNTGYKMWEMVVWIVWFSIPMLYEAEVDDKVIEVWGRFVALVVKVLDRSSLTPARVEEIRSIAIEHAEEFEKHFVNGVLANVQLVTISFHFLLHLADNITWHGHPSLYSQFPMERKLGWLKRLIRQFSNEYRTLELELSRHLYRDAVIFKFPNFFPPLTPECRSPPALLFKTAIWKTGNTTVPDPYWTLMEQLVQQWIQRHLTTSQDSTPSFLNSFRLKTRNYSRIFASLTLPNGAVVRSLRGSRKVDGREGYHVLGNDPGGGNFFATVISFIELQLPTTSISAAPSNPSPSISKTTYHLKPGHSFYRLALVFRYSSISQHFSNNQSHLLAHAQIAPFVGSENRTIELLPVERIKEVVGVLELRRRKRIYLFQRSSIVSSHIPSSQLDGEVLVEDDEGEEEEEEEGEGEIGEGDV
ncbi:hypothetical protein JCM5350_002891 [Sporobolomyces pararoseus]